uniref:Uncharacterized protein n=1 Tax=Arion vulgaris TaxID=1028688 RepID=A0A0B7AQD0_9EUPU
MPEFIAVEKTKQLVTVIQKQSQEMPCSKLWRENKKKGADQDQPVEERDAQCGSDLRHHVKDGHRPSMMTRFSCCTTICHIVRRPLLYLQQLKKIIMCLDRKPLGRKQERKS